MAVMVGLHFIFLSLGAEQHNALRIIASTKRQQTLEISCRTLIKKYSNNNVFIANILEHFIYLFFFTKAPRATVVNM